MRKQIPIVGEMTANIASRDTTITGYESGAKYINGYFEQYKGVTDNSYRGLLDISQKYEFVKRPGIENHPVTSFAGTAVAPVLGGTVPYILDGARSQYSGGIILLWSFYNGLNTWCQVSYDNTVLPTPAGWATSGGILTLLDGISMAGYDAAVTNGADGGLINATTFIRITDANYIAFAGSGFSTNMVGMDGFIFQGSASTNKIFNCTINTPTVWAATSYITANIHPGSLIALRRLRHYLVAFKEASIEFFENTGQPTPGSPLSSVKQLSRTIGAVHGAYIKHTHDGIIFAGKSPGGLFGIYKLVADTLEIKKISNSYVDSLISVGGEAGVSTGNLYDFRGGSGAGTCSQFGCNVVPWKGREFYVLPLNTSAFSLVYDNSNETWTIWSRNRTGVEESFYVSCVVLNSVSSVANVHIGLTQSETSTVPLRLSETIYQDYSASSGFARAITCQWTSPVMDFGTLRRKFQSSLEVYYKLSGSGIGSSGSLSMYYYDDDKGTAATARAGTLTPAGGRIIWRRLGSFFRRRYVLGTISNVPLRLGVVECDLQQSEADLD